MASGNFATMNPLHRTSNSVVYSNGNLTTSPGSNWSTTTYCRSTMVIPKDKKIYVEMKITSNHDGQYMMLGCATNLSVPSSTNVGGDGSVTLYFQSKYVNGTETGSWITGASAGDILQLAVDGSNNKVWLGYNNTWGGSGDPANGTNEAGTINTSAALGDDLFIVSTQNSASTVTMNFGQDDTFAGEETAAGNADGNGFGVFKYSPPSGFLALCTANLSISDDIDPAQTDSNYPAKQCNPVVYTGNGTGQSITGMGFKPDLLWCKMASSSQNNQLYDSSRLNNRGTPTPFGLRSDTNGVEFDDQTTGNNNPIIASFDNDGFTLGTSGSGPNDNTRTYVAWAWRANGGTTSTNTSGDITSAVQANTKAGFSIVTYTGNGSVAQSVGHGLSSGAPELIFVKNRDANDDWAVYHVGSGNAVHMILNTSAAKTTSSAYWGTFTPTTTLFKVGSDHKLNASTEKYVSYCWHGVEGYSKFGSYEGNGNADGIVVNTGFRPRIFFVKDIDRSENWVTFDTERSSTGNPTDDGIFWNDSAAQTTGSGTGFKVDVLSNGFKFNTNHDNLNGSSTYIYGAWGDVPFKYNNGF